MSKCKTTIASMIREGYYRATVNGVKCLKLYAERTIMFVSTNKDGFMTVKQAAKIQHKYGKASRIHTCYDTSRRRRRITGMDFYVPPGEGYGSRFSARDIIATEPQV